MSSAWPMAARVSPARLGMPDEREALQDGRAVVPVAGDLADPHPAPLDIPSGWKV
jgi:hypothetical protein